MILKNSATGFLILFITVLNFPVRAQQNQIKIEDFTYRDGLNTSGVNSVYKDSRGFLWICSNNGLFRYDGYNFKNINTIAKGYLKCETYCITEDKNKNFWIGTAGSGIYYYNTHSAQLFNLRLSEGDNLKINKIHFFNQKVWMATNQGLLVCSENTEINENSVLQVKVLWPDPDNKTLQMNVINYIYTRPGSKSIWVATNSPLYELNPETYQFKKIESFKQNSIRWIADYDDKKILISSWDGGVFLVNSGTQKLEYDSYINEINKIIGDKRVKSAILDKQNRCWVATYGDGLFIFSHGQGGKLVYENFRNEEDSPLKLKTNFIDQIFLDGAGTVWISMAETGLSKIFYQESKMGYINFHETNSSNSKEIHAITSSSDRNQFWISFNRNEINLFNTEAHLIHRFTNRSKDLQLQNDKIKQVYQDRKGNLWIIYSRIGIYVVPAKYALKLVNGQAEGTIRPLDANNLFCRDAGENSYILSFFDDSKGRLWVCSWGDAYVLNFRDQFFTSTSSAQLIENTSVNQIYSEKNGGNFNFTIFPVNAIYEVDPNHYWLGTRNGGITEIEELPDGRFSGKKSEINDQLPGNYITGFYKDKSHNLWIGTNLGLCLLKNKNLKVIGLNNGLSSEYISTISEDLNRNIWISTSFGISKIKKGDYSVYNFLNYETEKLNQFITNVNISKNTGNIWFSTNESLVYFNPDSLEISSKSSPITFTDIKINNHTIMPMERFMGIKVIENEINQCNMINVPYRATLNIEFASLDYQNHDKVQYKYKIGKNNEWNILSPGQRSLNIPNINSGKYLLTIMVSNSMGSVKEKTIIVHFLPPFWLSWIAYLIYLLIIVGFLFFYRKSIIKKTIQKSLIEKERYERRKIEELDKMKTDFFSNISHEFRTPLSLIINPLEKLIKEGSLSEKDINKIRLVLKSSNRLLKLTNELMDFSKLENNILKPDFQNCEIVSLTTELCQLFNNLADTANIDLKLNLSFDRLEIPIDKGMIEKALFNLLSNAFKYTNAHGIILVNLSRTFHLEGEFVKISVINTGEGIKEDNISKIFDRYYQVNNDQNRQIEGTGIGLSLVKSFIDLHKGFVEVKSQPRLETSFDLYLPIHQQNIELHTDQFSGMPLLLPNKDGKVNKYQEENDTMALRLSNKYRILIIEDEEDIIQYIMDELSVNYKVISARNGEEGLKIANETLPDLIITDVMMPYLSGIELCKKLRNQVITSHIPIIILSAKTTVHQQLEGLEMGADVYMLKPFNIDILKLQVQRLISLKQSIYAKYLKETTLIPQDAITNKLDDEFIKKVMNFIDDNLTNSELNVDQLANCISLSKVQTYRKVKAISGLSIVEFIRTVRLKKASQLIIQSQLNFSEIAFETGFSTPSYFSKCFHDHFGKTPSEFAAEFANRESDLS